MELVAHWNVFMLAFGSFFRLLCRRALVAMTKDGGRQLESARTSATIYDVRTAEATKSNALCDGGLGKPMGALAGGL